MEPERYGILKCCVVVIIIEYTKVAMVSVSVYIANKATSPFFLPILTLIMVL